MRGEESEKCTLVQHLCGNVGQWIVSAIVGVSIYGRLRLDASNGALLAHLEEIARMHVLAPNSQVIVGSRMAGAAPLAKLVPFA